MIDDDERDLNQRIAEQVRALRAVRGLSLEALAERSGVSRSMISLIERGESNPTAVLLNRLAAGLEVALGRLFDPPEPAAEPVVRRRDQPTWRDPQSGYLRRNVSPSGFPSPIRITEIEFPAGAEVTFDSNGGGHLHEQIWVLEGAIEVQHGEDRHALTAGDCFACVLDRPTAFRNRSRVRARYAVVVASDGPRAR